MNLEKFLSFPHTVAVEAAVSTSPAGWWLHINRVLLYFPIVKFTFIPELWLFPGKIWIIFTPTKTNQFDLVLL